MSALTIIIAKHPQDPRYDAATQALASPDAITLPDLYHIPDNDPAWDTLRSLTGPAVVYGPLHPRATEWLMRRHDVETDGWEFHRCEAGETVPGDRWYPVMDRSLCTNCQHCLQFCLFGVYTLEDGQVTVTSPDACKDGCPACSRVCPQSAIMFPLYEDPAIAGAPGLRVERDAAARRMFYQRTGQRCPVCRTPDAALSQVLPDGTCPECGRRLKKRGQSPLLKEIDELIDRLDEASGK